MSWEKRGNGRYYYRKRRIGKSVMSEYVGAGLIAEVEAELAKIERHEQHRERQALKQQREAVDALDKDLRDIGDLILNLTRANLLLAGYHPHKGQWRKRRDGR